MIWSNIAIAICVAIVIFIFANEDVVARGLVKFIERIEAPLAEHKRVISYLVSEMSFILKGVLIQAY